MADIVPMSQGGADPYPIPDDPELEPGAAGEDAGEMTEADDGEAATDEVPEFGEMPGDDDPAGQAAYRHWQGVFTKHRERDIAESRKLREEHERFSQVLANFNSSDDFALNILRQRFPHLAAQLNNTAPSANNTPTTGGGDKSEKINQLLAQYDLGFLAPVFEEMLQIAAPDETHQKVQSIEQRLSQREDDARKREEDRLMLEMDGSHPDWRERYGNDMKALDDFLGGDQLTHPKFGNKYELYYRLLNPDAARVEAARGMGDAARRAVRTGRTGSTPAPNITQQMRKATTDREAWDMAVRAAEAETGSR